MAADRSYAALEAHLEKERRLMLEGRIDGLEPLLERRLALAENLTGHADEQTLVHLRGLAERNSRLAAAARSGIQDAIRRLQQINAAQGPFETYSAGGQRQSVGPKGASVEHKA